MTVRRACDRAMLSCESHAEESSHTARKHTTLVRCSELKFPAGKPVARDVRGKFFTRVQGEFCFFFAQNANYSEKR